jgi:hypothetical protein
MKAEDAEFSYPRPYLDLCAPTVEPGSVDWAWRHCVIKPTMLPALDHTSVRTSRRINQADALVLYTRRQSFRTQRAIPGAQHSLLMAHMSSIERTVDSAVPAAASLATCTPATAALRKQMDIALHALQASGAAATNSVNMYLEQQRPDADFIDSAANRRQHSVQQRKPAKRVTQSHTSSAVHRRKRPCNTTSIVDCLLDCTYGNPKHSTATDGRAAAASEWELAVLPKGLQSKYTLEQSRE